jgi:hypothetical protein
MNKESKKEITREGNKIERRAVRNKGMTERMRSEKKKEKTNKFVNEEGRCLWTSETRDCLSQPSVRLLACI